jgi:hypothetical protein
MENNLDKNYCFTGEKKIKYIENLNNEYNTFHGVKSQYFENCRMYNDSNTNKKQLNTLPFKDLKIHDGVRNVDNESEIILSKTTKSNGRSNNVLSGVCIPRYIPQFYDTQNVNNIIMDIPRGGISTRGCD